MERKEREGRRNQKERKERIRKEEQKRGMEKEERGKRGKKQVNKKKGKRREEGERKKKRRKGIILAKPLGTPQLHRHHYKGTYNYTADPSVTAATGNRTRG